MGNINFFASKHTQKSEKTYKVLIVDDDLAIQKMTKLILSDFDYKSYSLEFLTAFSAREAKEVLLENNDIAVVLLDVVMESNDAGFLVVEYIRDELKNNTTRIIISTGQPGFAPEKEVLVKYEINDYVEKTDLKSVKLFSKVVAAIRSYQDLIDIYKVNEELKKSNMLLRETEQVANMGIWEINREVHSMVLSEQLLNIFELEEFPSYSDYEDLMKFVHKDDREKVIDRYEKSLENRDNYRNEFKIVCKNGKVKYVEEKCIHLLGNNKQILKSFGTIQDITEKKLVEIEIKQQEEIITYQSKMASMGEMIENITHQWRQPLSSISSIIARLHLKNELKELTQEILHESTKKINLIVQQQSQTLSDFRDFFKIKQANHFSLDETIDKTLNLLESQFKSSGIIVLNKVEDIEMYGFENHLVQVLLNILNNARDELMKKDSQVKIVIIEVNVSDNKLEILITDNAGGVPSSIIGKIFESRFTTKSESLGTGIGLYMSKLLVTEHMKGKLDVSNVEFEHENCTYKGAQFKISISMEEEL